MAILAAPQGMGRWEEPPPSTVAPSGCLHLGVQLQPCPSVQSSVPQRRTAAETPPHSLPSIHRGKLLAVAQLFVEDNADLESIIDLITFRQHSNKLQGHLVLWRVIGTKQVRIGLAAAREKVLDPHLILRPMPPSLSSPAALLTCTSAGSCPTCPEVVQLPC